MDLSSLPEVPAPDSGIVFSTGGAHIAINAEYLYFMLSLNIDSPDGGALQQGVWNNDILRLPKAGGEVVRIATNDRETTFIWGLAVNETDVVFSRAPQAKDGNAAIVRAPADGGDPVALADAQGRAAALTADNENVYFVDNEATRAVSLSGGEARTLAPPVTVVTNALTAVGQTLYIADYDGNAISSVPIAGGKATMVAPDVLAPRNPIACGSDLCFFSGNPLNMSVMRLSPGGTPVALAQGLHELHALVSDDNNLFVAVSSIGSLQRVPTSGGDPVPVGPVDVGDLALDDECLYWSTHDGIYNVSRTMADGANDDVLTP